MADTDFERQARQALYMWVGAIAAAFGPDVAARVVKGLYEKYATVPAGNLAGVAHPHGNMVQTLAAIAEASK